MAEDTNKKKRSTLSDIYLKDLISPVILLLLGAYFSWSNQKAADKMTGLDMAQKMLPTLFSDNPYQVFATEKLLSHVVDPALAADMQELVERSQMQELEASLRDHDTVAAATIYTAAHDVGGTSAKLLQDSVTKRTELQGFALEAKDILVAAKNEQAGFDQLKSGDYVAAKASFDAAQRAHPTSHVTAIAGILHDAQPNIADTSAMGKVRDQITQSFAVPHLKFSWKQ